MSRAWYRSAALGAAGLAAALTCGLAATSLEAADATASQIRRGEYLAARVGLCGDCHTPMTAKGEPDAKRAMQGAPIGFRPMQPVPGWAAAAPPIAGMAGWSDADALKFLQTGLAPGGKRAAPPMPWYRFSRSDAEALLAYLRSLAPAAGKPADK